MHAFTRGAPPTTSATCSQCSSPRRNDLYTPRCASLTISTFVLFSHAPASLISEPPASSGSLQLQSPSSIFYYRFSMRRPRVHHAQHSCFSLSSPDTLNLRPTFHYARREGVLTALNRRAAASVLRRLGLGSLGIRTPGSRFCIIGAILRTGRHVLIIMYIVAMALVPFTRRGFVDILHRLAAVEVSNTAISHITTALNICYVYQHLPMK